MEELDHQHQNHQSWPKVGLFYQIDKNKQKDNNVIVNHFHVLVSRQKAFTNIFTRIHNVFKKKIRRYNYK